MKKALCLLLVLFMVSSAVLFGCAPVQESESSAASSATSSVAEVSEEASTGELKYEANIPEGTRFDGVEFKFLTCSVNKDHESEIVFNVYEDGQEGMATVVNEAIAERNNLVEDILGVKITEECVEDPQRKNGAFCNRIRTDQASGTADYYVVVPCLYDAATLASDGKLVDLASIDTMNLESPWWSQVFVDECTIGGKLYFALSDIGYVSAASVPALAFNRTWIEQYGLEDPYQLVHDKKWTLDKAIEMTKTHKEDKNGDNAITYADIFGWAGQYDDMWSLFYGSGEKIASVGSDGYPILTMYNDRSVTVIDKMQQLVQDKEYYVCANDYFGAEGEQWPTVLTLRAFVEGRCLFFNGGLGDTQSYAKMTDQFGLLPIPMLDENQDGYHSLANPWVSTCFAVPASVSSESDLAMVGYVLDVMGAESKNHVENAFVNTVLQYQKTPDEATWTIIKDYILPSKGCDVGFMFAWGGLDILLQDMVKAPAGSFASSYDQKDDAAQLALEETVNFFKALK